MSKKKSKGGYKGLRPDVYRALRKQGASKEKAARIANAAGAGTLASWNNKKRKGKKKKK